MPWFSLNTLIMIEQLSVVAPGVKQAWLADDASAGGSLESLVSWYGNLIKTGEKFGYYVNLNKSWLILKSPETFEDAKRLFGDRINISLEGQRHLGAVIGSEKFKDEFCTEKVSGWVDDLEALCEIAKSEPHAAYQAYTKGYYSKFLYFMRTIKDFGSYLKPVENLLTTKFIPTLLGMSEPPDVINRRLYALPPKNGGLNIKFPSAEPSIQYQNSISITKGHVNAIVKEENT